MKDAIDQKQSNDTIHDDVNDNKDDTDVRSAGDEFQDELFSMWLSNKNSAPDVQRIASKARKAGAGGVDNISKIGGEGKFKHLQDACN